MVAALILLYVVNMIWVEKDAVARGVTGNWVGIVALTWPFGLLAWIVFRPVRLSSRQSAPRKST
jgi:hypothetical protein